VLLRTWIDKGSIDESHVKDVKRILIRLLDRLDVDKSVDAELGFSAGIGEKGIGIDAGLAVPIRTGRIWGMILERLPGRRYLKVLRRLKLADQAYAHLDRHLRTVWSNA
jgi:hypothetical protein